MSELAENHEQQPEQVAAATAPTATESHQPEGEPKRRGGGFAIFMSLVAFAAAGGTAGGGYWLWQQFEELKGSLQAARSDRQAVNTGFDQLGRAQQELRGRVAGLAQELDAMGQAQRIQADQITLIRNTPPPQPEARDDGPDLLIAELRHLLHLAGQRLALAADPAGALLALQLADQRLAEAHDAAFGALREALAGEITQLQAVKPPETAALFAALGESQARVEALPLPGGEPPRFEPVQAEGAPVPMPWQDWDGFVTALKDDLKKQFTVRQGREVKLPLVGPEQQFFLRQNLLLKLDMARLALLKGEAGLYRQSLIEAALWLDRYSDNADATALAAGLRRLSDQPIAVALPRLGASTAALERVAAQRPPRPQPRPVAPAPSQAAPAAVPVDEPLIEVPQSAFAPADGAAPSGQGAGQ